jgi:transcriptional regulator with XRE-family HTH domain
MTNLQNIANAAIEKLRKAKKLSREDMAMHLDISLEAYRKIENGVTKLTLDRLAQICEVLGSNFIEVLDEKNEKYNIKEVKDKAIGVNTGTVNHETNPKEQTVTQQAQSQNQQLLKQVEMLLAHNQQLIEENARLRGV